MLLGQLFVVAGHDLAEPTGVPHEVVLLEHLDRGEAAAHGAGASCRSGLPRRRAPRSAPRSAARSRGRRAAGTTMSGPLAVDIRSGTTSQWFTENHSPVRPKPAITSSAIITMPNSVQSSRTPCRYPSGGIRMPFVPTTGSRMNAAIVSGPSSSIVSRSRAAPARRRRARAACRGTGRARARRRASADSRSPSVSGRRSG